VFRGPPRPPSRRRGCRRGRCRGQVALGDHPLHPGRGPAPPGWTSPANHAAGGSSAIDAALTLRRSLRGRSRSARPGPRSPNRVGTTITDLSVWAATCSATGMMFLFVRQDHHLVGGGSPPPASSSSRGRRVHRLASGPRSAARAGIGNSRRTPAPMATATTPVVHPLLGRRPAFGGRRTWLAGPSAPRPAARGGR